MEPQTEHDVTSWLPQFFFRVNVRRICMHTEDSFPCDQEVVTRLRASSRLILYAKAASLAATGRFLLYSVHVSALYQTRSVMLLFTVVQRDKKLSLLVGDCAHERPFTIPTCFEFGYG